MPAMTGPTKPTSPPGSTKPSTGSNNDFVISPKELRDVDIATQFRGYDRDEVNEMLERAARTLEHLGLLARGRPSTPPADPITPTDLVDGDISEVMRGYHKDTVNDLAERAARTIELLQSRPRDAAGGPITAQVTTIESPDAGSSLVASVSEPALAANAAEPVLATNVVVGVELGERRYDVHIGPGAIAQLMSVLAGRRRAAVVSQPDIMRAHGNPVLAALDLGGVTASVCLMPDGEPAKSLVTVDDLCTQFAESGLLRDDAVVALGGGVVGDVAGFAAAVYHRGIDVVQVPTTLLAMVDSAIGGKTGVNLSSGKNLVGAFHQPRAVLADPSVLTTLPDPEFRCGLGEVAKYALLGDEELVDILTNERDAVLARRSDVLGLVIQRSVAMKARFVAADEFERSGLRAHLNYGHTLGHAIEIAAAHSVAHGEAVAVGLVFAAELAGALERIDHADVERHRALVTALGLPARAPDGLDANRVIDLMRRDKKAAGGLTFMLMGAGPNGTRSIERVDDPPEAAVRAALAAVGIR